MKIYVAKIEVKAEDIDGILSSALGGSGIAYWCDEVATQQNPNGEDFIYDSESLTHGHILRVHEDGETEDDKGKWHNLTLKKMLKGIALAIQSGDLDLENYDGPQSDMVVQYALFGEVVYA